MPIPLGTWQANVGGTRQALVIRSVETTGRVTGEITTAPFPVPLLGVWDEDAQKLTFVLYVRSRGVGLSPAALALATCSVIPST